jgi:hypothetical protein
VHSQVKQAAEVFSCGRILLIRKSLLPVSKDCLDLVGPDRLRRQRQAAGNGKQTEP